MSCMFKMTESCKYLRSYRGQAATPNSTPLWVCSPHPLPPREEDGGGVGGQNRGMEGNIIMNTTEQKEVKNARFLWT